MNADEKPLETAILIDNKLASIVEDLPSKTLFLEAFDSLSLTTFEPRHEKINVLHMRKQRRRSASR